MYILLLRIIKHYVILRVRQLHKINSSFLSINIWLFKQSSRWVDNTLLKMQLTFHTNPDIYSFIFIRKFFSKAVLLELTKPNVTEKGPCPTC